MSDESTTRVSLHDHPRGRTDLDALATITDEAIEAAVASDPDAAPLGLDWSKAEVVTPAAPGDIVRVDDDVLAYFKAGGAGYPRRINAVLRAFMEARRARKTG